MKAEEFVRYRLAAPGTPFPIIDGPEIEEGTEVEVWLICKVVRVRRISDEGVSYATRELHVDDWSGPVRLGAGR